MADHAGAIRQNARMVLEIILVLPATYGDRDTTAIVDAVIMASTDAAWLSLFSSEGSTLEGTGPFAQACSQETWPPMMS